MDTASIDLWAEVRKLEGLTLKTLGHHSAFDLLRVDPKKVVVYIHRSGRERAIRGAEIERAFQALVQERHISRIDIQARYSPRCPAYVAAILSRLPGVTYTLKPIRLWYQSEKQESLLFE